MISTALLLLHPHTAALLRLPFLRLTLSLSSPSLSNFIVNRQAFVMQLITYYQIALLAAKVPVWLYTYRILRYLILQYIHYAVKLLRYILQNSRTKANVP